MAKKKPLHVEEVRLQWGWDRLIIREPSWCQSIQAEGSLPSPDDFDSLYERFSREDEIEVRMGVTDRNDYELRPKGVRRLSQPAIAERCLKEFLGLELPAALLLSDGFGMPNRMVVLRARLDTVQLSSTINAHLVFDGLQLYANGHIGRPVRTVGAYDCEVRRRALDNVWREISFDGEVAEPKPTERWSPIRRRTFCLSEGLVLESNGLAITGG